MACASYVYETLGPLSLSESDPSDSYAVFRNHITSSSGPSLEIAAADYFALDGTAEVTTSEETPSPTPDPRAVEGKAASEFAWFCAGRRFKSPMFRLHKEILDFCDFVSPTPEEQASRTAAVQRVFEVVKYIWPHCNVEVFGSFRTGLYLPTSDIDAVILNSKVTTPQMGLRALSRALSQRSIAKKIQVIGKARVPIVKFVEKQSGIAFDICFDAHGGPKAAEFIKDVVIKIPSLRALCLILKVFLQQRELNEVFSGGIGSYALLAMLIAHLKKHWIDQDLLEGQTSVEHNLGILLVSFFDFYGRKLNNWDVGVSCNSAGSLFLKSSKGFLNTDRSFLLSIEDPQAPDNDIGRSSYNYFKVRSAFAMAYSSLTDAKTIGLGPERSILGTIIRPDPVLLERKGGYNGELTFNRLLPGAGEPVPLRFGNGCNISCNWQLMDDEPLPREKVVDDNSSLSSRKRRALKANPSSSGSNHGKVTKIRCEENGGSRETKSKKQRRRACRDEDGFVAHVL